METTMDLTRCPECGAPAEITDRFVLESTDGPVEHARVDCAGGHWFLLSVATLYRSRRRQSGPPAPRPTPADRP
jgi:hypothetical protein